MKDCERESWIEELEERIFFLIITNTDETRKLMGRLLDIQVHLEQLFKLYR